MGCIPHEPPIAVMGVYLYTSYDPQILQPPGAIWQEQRRHRDRRQRISAPLAMKGYGIDDRP